MSNTSKNSSSKKLVLTISLLLNVAGIVALCFLISTSIELAKQKKKTRHLERQALITNYEKLNQLEDRSARVLRRDFVSRLDGRADSFLLSPPLSPAPEGKHTLFVYLHGMGASYREPYGDPGKFLVADEIQKAYPYSVFISLNYRSPASWGEASALSDISQNIDETMQAYPTSEIILLGCSMGGCTVLNYAACAPESIKAKLKGIVSIESAGDLAVLFDKTSARIVKQAMVIMLKGTPKDNPDAYRQASFFHNIQGLPKQVRIAVVSAKKDSTVPPEMQKQIIERLQSMQVKSKLIEIDTNHGLPEPSVFIDAIKFTLAKDSA
ncbi:MAG: prolyl oligopeptidase family serine peptidase [Cyanobacteria bacterium TGS_CYA1]|nr:prolyl oligopeptidase family serine peptidase [Cyanobacteria bacterium TGS_CYA1]